MSDTKQTEETQIEMTVPVTMGPPLRDGTQTIVGSMPANLLVPNNYEVPLYDHEQKEGYQRESTASRVKKLKVDLEKNKVDLPTAVLLNLRDVSSTEILTEGNDKKGLSLNLENIGPFYVVDGQHRLRALHLLVEENPKKWNNLLLPFVCMIGATFEREMKEFYVVNSNAKSVRTDLAMTLLKEMSNSNPSIMEDLVEKGDKWKVIGQKIVEQIAHDSPIWENLIRFPNHDKDKGKRIINSAAMVNSLQPLLKTPYFENMNINNQVNILGAYWQGIKEIFPEAFDEPFSYSIQKGLGVLVLHNVMRYALEYIRSENLSVIESDSYKKAMQIALEELDGDRVGDGVTVEGLDFWKVGIEGAAGAYSSETGRRVLIEKIKTKIPEIDVVVS